MMKISKEERIAILKDCAIITPELEKSLEEKEDGI